MDPITLDQLRAELAKARAEHPCPACGHCPTCGRGGYHTAPYPYGPWTPAPTPWYPWITYGTGTGYTVVDSGTSIQC